MLREICDTPCIISLIISLLSYFVPWVVSTLRYSRSHLLYRMVHLEATPTSSLMDDLLQVHVKGLSPQQHVTMATILQEPGDAAFVSYGHYIANDEGVVDVAGMESLGGTYTGMLSFTSHGKLLMGDQAYQKTPVE